MPETRQFPAKHGMFRFWHRLCTLPTRRVAKMRTVFLSLSWLLPNARRQASRTCSDRRQSEPRAAPSASACRVLGAEEYWSLSKARLHHWAEWIKSFTDQLHARPIPAHSVQLWTEVRPVLEEIFLAEICTRVWCATLAVVDHHQSSGELDPIGRSVFVGHLEARRRALRLLLFGRGLKSAPAAPLNRLRRDCERWADVLLANLVPSRIARQFAVDTNRVKAMVTRGFAPVVSRRTYQRWSAQLVALHFFLVSRAASTAACAELNAQIAAAILRCLPPASFDSCGIVRPGWHLNRYQSDLSVSNVATELCGIYPHYPSGLSFQPSDRL